MKKAQFPRICLPVIALGTATFNFLVIGALFLLFMALTGQFPGLVLLAALPALAVQFALAGGLGMLFATVNVFFRDVGQAVTLGMQFWFWLTPIVYPASALPTWAQSLVAWNPMTVIVAQYQVIVLHQRVPDAASWRSLAAVAVLAALALWLGLRVYRRRVGELVDEL
jgi:lipopolysaccharide transport system permease protein